MDDPPGSQASSIHVRPLLAAVNQTRITVFYRVFYFFLHVGSALAAPRLRCAAAASGRADQRGPAAPYDALRRSSVTFLHAREYRRRSRRRSGSTPVVRRAPRLSEISQLWHGGGNRRAARGCLAEGSADFSSTRPRLVAHHGVVAWHLGNGRSIRQRVDFHGRPRLELSAVLDDRRTCP